jgi:tRNA A37 methylthiotransferase MiaB
LRAEGYLIVPTYQDADLVVVNTCGFIDSAVEESLDAIGEALRENGKVIVTGCLGARESVIIKDAHPGVLAVTGPHATEEVMAPCTRICRNRTIPLRSGSARWTEADAAPLRLSEDFRRLQPSLHLLHHPQPAR